MAIKKLQHDFTNPEQSKRLLELGVPVDSANGAYRGPHMPITVLSPNELYSEHEKEIHDLESKRDRREGRFQTCEPCWTVGRLVEIYDICRCYDGDWDEVYGKETLIETYVSAIEEAVLDDMLDFSKLEDN